MNPPRMTSCLIGGSSSRLTGRSSSCLTEGGYWLSIEQSGEGLSESDIWYELSSFWTELSSCLTGGESGLSIEQLLSIMAARSLNSSMVLHKQVFTCDWGLSQLKLGRFSGGSQRAPSKAVGMATGLVVSSLDSFLESFACIPWPKFGFWA